MRETTLASCRNLYGAIERSNTPATDFLFMYESMKTHQIEWAELDPAKTREQIQQDFHRRFRAAVNRVTGIKGFDIDTCQAIEERASERTRAQMHKVGRRDIAKHPVLTQ